MKPIFYSLIFRGREIIINLCQVTTIEPNSESFIVELTNETSYTIKDADGKIFQTLKNHMRILGLLDL